MTAEIGATAAWSRFNVSMASAMLQEAAAQVGNVRAETIPSDIPGATAMGFRVPAGVVLSIAPWNAPLILAMRAIAFPAAYGNTVVLKASELSTATHLALGEVELGGKNPLIVLDDADLDYAARAAVFGAFANNGQACMAANRIIVLRSVVDAFVEGLRTRAEALQAGDPRDPRTQIGPLAGPAAPARHGADPAWVNVLLTRGSNPAGAGEAVGALVKFARKMAREPYKSVEADVSALHAAGWANEDLVELLSVISLSAYMDTLSLSLRIGPQAAPQPAN